VAEELLMHAIRLEPAGGSSHEGRSRTRKVDITGANDQEPSQQLKQAKLAITELYQENMELRRQLATKTMEASAAQGREGNMAWLKRQLREVQDTIVQLREAQRLMKKGIQSIPENVKRPRRKPAWLSPARRKNKFSWCSSLHLQT
jgi:hypothetical protein